MCGIIPNRKDNFLKLIISKNKIIKLLFVFYFLGSAIDSNANVIITMPSGGTISADSAANGTSPKYVSIGNFLITEGLTSDFAVGNNVTVTLNIPTGWLFNAAAAITAVTTGGGITGVSVLSKNSTTITIGLTVGNSTRKNTLTISGVEVMATDGGNVPGNGNITRGGTAIIAGCPAGATLGSLSQTYGAIKELVVTLPGQTFSDAITYATSGNAGTPSNAFSGTSFTITKIRACDQFYNVVTSYSGLKTITYSGPNNGLTAPSYITSVSFASGVSTTVLTTTLKKAEITMLTVTDGTVPGLTSPSFTVFPGTLNKFLVEKSGGGNIPSQNVSSLFTIKVSAQDAENNICSSGTNNFSGTVNITSTGTLSSGSGTSASFTNGVLSSHGVTISNVGTFTITATQTAGSSTGTSNSFSVDASTLNNFLIEASSGGNIGSQIAGTPFTIKITARDIYNNTCAIGSNAFTGTVNITSTGSLLSGAGTTASFVAGILTSHTINISNTGTFTISAVNTLGSQSGISNSFAVTSGALNNFLVESVAGGNIPTQIAGVSFNIKLTARDAYNNICNAVPNLFSGTANITSTGTLSAGGGTTASFSTGVLASSAITMSTSGTFTITATRTGFAENGTSNLFTVNNPLPVLTSISPACVIQGGSSFTLTLNGSGFNPASTARLSGSSRTTVYISPTQIQATINSSDISAAGTVNIDVSSPTPGGGTSSTQQLTISAPTIIASQPVTQNACIGSSTGFTVIATGNILTYQWKKNGVALTNGGNISGATSSTLLINPIGFTDSSANYSVTIGSSCFGNVNSNSVVLVVDSLSNGGTITGGTPDCAGNNNGTLTLSSYRGTILRWESSTDNFSTAPVTIANTINTYSYTNLNQTTYFRAVVKNGNCSASNSSSIVVTIYPIPANPGNPTTNSPQCSGNTVTLTRIGSVPATETWYWQTTAAGTNTSNSASTYAVATSGIYYIRAKSNSASCWSVGSGSALAIFNSPTSSTANISICAGQSYTPPGGTSQTTSGTYVTVIANAAGCDSTITTNLTVVNPNPIQNNVSICIGGSVTLPNSSVVYPIITGDYLVTLNGQYCDSIINTHVEVHSLPGITATANQIPCNGTVGSVTLSASNGLAPYNFSGSQTANLLPGNYSYTVTDANGCIAIAAATINAVPTILTLTATTQQIRCFGSSGSVTLSAAGGSPTYIYSGATTNLLPGTYQYSVIDSRGCQATVSATLDPTPPQLIITAVAQQIACYGGKGNIIVTASGGTPTYTFSNQVKVNLSPGTYLYSVTDSKGCVASTSAFIAAAPTRLTGVTSTTTTKCNANTGTANIVANGGSSPYAFLWNTNPTQSTQYISGLSEGTYTVLITDIRSCTTTVQAIVKKALPTPVAITSKSVVCPDQIVSLCVPTGFTLYTWSTGDTVRCTNVDTAGTYTIVVENINGCTSSATKTLTAGETPRVAITGNNNICPASPLSLCATSGFTTYTWSNGLRASCINVTAGGNYVCTVTNSAGCTASVTKPVTSAMALSATKVNGICSNGYLGSAIVNVIGQTGPYNYLWSNGGTTQSISGLAPATYTVRVTDINGCSATASAVVAVTQSTADYSKITSFFMDRDIVPGTYIWFNAAVNINYTGSYPVTIRFINQNILSTRFNISPPNSKLILTNTVAQATTEFNGTEWVTIAPPNLSGQYFISGYSYPVTSTIVKNLNPVAWKGIWTASCPGLSAVNWKWSAAVYTNFTTSLDSLGVKPVDDNTSSLYSNFDLAGSPENYTAFCVIGARTGGDVNYTGIYTPLVSRTPCSPLVCNPNEPVVRLSGKNPEQTINQISINAYPNPFNTKITFELERTDKSANTSIEIYNLSGQRITKIFDEKTDAGIIYTLQFDARNLNEGIYICKIISGDAVINKKLVLKK